MQLVCWLQFRGGEERVRGKLSRKLSDIELDLSVWSVCCGLIMYALFWVFIWKLSEWMFRHVGRLLCCL